MATNQNTAFQKMLIGGKDCYGPLTNLLLSLASLPTVLWLFSFHMHPALLIDEILENILNHVLDWDSEKEYRWTLAQLARCCKSWKDPALDRIWKRLADMKPIVGLESQELSSYTSRVKQITLRGDTGYSPSEHVLAFPRLQYALLEGAGCNAPINWALSHSLHRLKVDMRCTNSKVDVQYERCEHVTKIVQHIQNASNEGLQKLHLRGCITSSLNRVIGVLTSLRSLTLLTGSTLTPRLLTEITTFPFLQELRLHAAHIDADWFRTTKTPSESPTFPSLRRLHIRGQQSLIHAIVELLQLDTLEHLYLEADRPALDITAWTPIMDTLAVKASRSLRQLTIEHCTELDTPTNNIHLMGLSSFTLQHIKSLSNCAAMRKFTLDTTLPIKFTDRDIEDMSSWWPFLECLDLGALPGPHEDPACSPTLTVKALSHLAGHCPELKDLIIPLDLSASSEDDPSEVVPQQKLKTLRIGRVADSKSISSFVQTVLMMFPSVEAIECETSDGEVPVALPGRQEPDTGAGTEDELANGQ
ncbi:unnamed protein product [Somion occarium]|uniref:F-box domain-containing protein n=1 Tax=Somion occarium TaxID=3059160 RepID=A0ABP1E5V4_9APHY